MAVASVTCEWSLGADITVSSNKNKMYIISEKYRLLLAKNHNVDVIYCFILMTVAEQDNIT